MDNVIHMPPTTELPPVTPKSVTRRHNNHAYIITFKPDAPLHECWGWQIRLTRVYKFEGSASSKEKANTAAIKKIEEMEAVLGKDDSRG